MAKKTYTDPHTQIRNDVLEVLACSNLSGREFAFLMLLMRETFGRKNQDLPARGKMMPWDSALFTAGMGFNHSGQAGRIKAGLLRQRVIREWQPDAAKALNGPTEYCIGFNWNYNQWRCGFTKSIDDILEIKERYSKLSKKNNRGNKGVASKDKTRKQGRCLKETPALPEGNKGVAPTGDKPVPDTDLQSLKKERKGKKDRKGAKAPNGVSVTEEKKDPIYDGYCNLWNKYFAEGRDKRGENFKTTMAEYTRLVDGTEVTVDEVYDSLVKFKKGLEREYRPLHLYPYLKTWLSEERWLEERKEKVVLYIHSEPYTQEELDYAEQCWGWYQKWHDTDSMELSFADRQKKLSAINHFHNKQYIRTKLREENKNEQA